MITNRFPYRVLDRTTHADGSRFYVDPDTGHHLSSVTTILSATADKAGLLEWRAWVGDEKADRVRDEACALGTLMHTHLEHHLQGIPRPGGSNLIRKMAAGMADQIIARGLSHVTEVCGIEVALHYPGLYAGTTDLVCVYDGVLSIADYKTAKKMKTRAMIQDYLDQAAAYTLAHNHLYHTDIRSAVIFMVDRAHQFQSFRLEGLEMERHQTSFLLRLERFMAMRETLTAHALPDGTTTLSVVTV